MFWLLFLLVVFAVLHLALLVPTQVAIMGAVFATAVLWLLWKLKWIILGIIGLEEIFGGRNDGSGT